MEFGNNNKNIAKIEVLEDDSESIEDISSSNSSKNSNENFQNDFILDITDPNVVPGIPYYVLSGANEVLIFFDINQIGMKELFQIQEIYFIDTYFIFTSNNI